VVTLDFVEETPSGEPCCSLWTLVANGSCAARIVHDAEQKPKETKSDYLPVNVCGCTTCNDCFILFQFLPSKTGLLPLSHVFKLFCLWCFAWTKQCLHRRTVSWARRTPQNSRARNRCRSEAFCPQNVYKCGRFGNCFLLFEVIQCIC